MKKNKYNITIQQVVVSAGIILGMGILILIFALFGNVQAGASEEETADTETVELTLCYPYRDAQWNSAIETVIAAFEEEHPEIQITLEVPYSDSVYENELNKRIARGEFSDIVQLKTPKAYALTGLLGEISQEDAEEIGIEDTYEENGVIYGLGIVNSTSGIIYNKDIFDQYGLEEPETYEEFLALCRTLAGYGITPIGVGGDDLWHMEFWVNHFFRSDILEENENWQMECSNGSVSWTDEEVTEMFCHLTEVFQSGFVNSDWLSTASGALPYMMSEKEVAMIYVGAWTAEEIYELNGEINLGWFYLPDEEGNVCVDEMQDTFWSVSAECAADEEKYEAAVTFLKYFYEPENYAEVCDSVTAFSTISDTPEYELTGIQEKVISDFESNSSHITGFIGNEQTPQGFEEKMLTIVQEMLGGELTIEEAQEACQEAWEVCMEDLQ